MKRNLISCLLLAATLLSLAACQAAPEKSVVISKNDGAFDAALLTPNESDGNALGGSYVAYSSDFSSTDGSVQYHIRLGEDQVFDGALPVTQVRPHFFTVDDAKRVSSLLFGEANLFAWTTNRPLSKPEIEEKLRIWRQLITDDSLREIFGSDQQTIQVHRETLENMISRYSDPSQYAAAPEAAERMPISWTFRNDEEGNSDLEAGAFLGDRCYHYWVFNRDQSDYRVNNLSAYIMNDTVSANTENFAFMSKYYYQEMPTPEQLSEAQARAEALISQMQLGQWQIDSCKASAQYISEDKEVYYIEVTAVPVYNGIAVTRLPQVGNLKSQDAYAENYYYSDLNLRFLPDGSLLSLQLVSPMDVVQVINDNVNVIDFPALMAQVESQLALGDVHSLFFIESSDQSYSAEVVVDEIDLGLTRVRIKDNSTDFYYLPMVTVKGFYRIYNADGQVVYDLEAQGGEKRTLLVLNAVDSSVVNTSAGY